MKIQKTILATFDDGKAVPLGDDTLMAVRYMLALDDHRRAPALVLAIKFVRLRHNLGLKEAKDIVDALRNDVNLFL